VVVVQDHDGGDHRHGQLDALRGIEEPDVEALVLLEDIVVDHLDAEALLVDAWREAEQALPADEIVSGGGGAVLRLVLHAGIRRNVSTAHHPHLELAAVLHDGVVARLEVHPDGIVRLLLVAGVQLGLHLGEIAVRPLLDLAH